VPSLSAVELFAVAAFALIVIPGPAVLYIVSQSVGQGRAGGLAAVLGVEIGAFVHVAGAALGVSAILASSATAFSVLKLAGGAYLIVLGIRRLLERDSESQLVTGRTRPLGAIFRQGVIVNALNPKTALFFLAFLPQFVAPERGGVWSQALVLGFVFVGLGLVTDSLYALAAGTIGGLLRRRRNAVRYGSGVVFIALGATAALAKRTST